MKSILVVIILFSTQLALAESPQSEACAYEETKGMLLIENTTVGLNTIEQFENIFKKVDALCVARESIRPHKSTNQKSADDPVLDGYKRAVEEFLRNTP